MAPLSCPACVHRVESTLRSAGITTLWVSHDPEQPSRVGGRVMELPLGTITSLPPPPQQAPSSPVYRSNGGAQQQQQQSPHEAPQRVEVRVDSR
jgi:ABC-type sulfate/molybdate transport systems ATPase subunit